MPTSLAGRRPAGRSSSTSRSSTIASADTRRWGTYPQPNTNGKTLDYLSTFRGELHFLNTLSDSFSAMRYSFIKALYSLEALGFGSFLSRAHRVDSRTG